MHLISNDKYLILNGYKMYRWALENASKHEILNIYCLCWFLDSSIPEIS